MDENLIDAKQVGSHITEVSKNARATWFGLLGYLAFSLLTLMNLRHVDLFKGGAGHSVAFVRDLSRTVALHHFWPTSPSNGSYLSARSSYETLACVT